jgi:hypothetical protein
MKDLIHAHGFPKVRAQDPAADPDLIGVDDGYQTFWIECGSWSIARGSGRRARRLEPQQRASLLVRQKIEEAIGPLPHLANALLELGQ